MCMPCAWAMALDMSVENLLGELGHDGSKIIFPHLPEPMCRRAFHIQEFVHVALRHGKAVTPVEMYPVLQSSDGRATHTLLHPKNNLAVFTRLVEASRGVLEGATYRCRHMVAYDHGKVYDPRGYVYTYTRLASEAHQFFARCIWRVDPFGGCA